MMAVDKGKRNEIEMVKTCVVVAVVVSPRVVCVSVSEFE